MQLFQIISEDFFKPLTGKYKSTYIDCLELIYSTYKNELSFGVDREVVLSKLEEYFDETSQEEMVFDEDNEVAKDSRSKANAILRTLKKCNWLEYESGMDYREKVNLFDYSATMIESFDKIVKNEDMEYQSVISQIHGTLQNKEAYVKPYQFIIKRVTENTDELINGLKKLNTMIKKRIDEITRDKTAAQIVEDFFVYHKEIGSKAYHRIKTSDNISHFRIGIVESLRHILENEEIFKMSVNGYMEVEQVEDYFEAEEQLKYKIRYMIFSFNNYDQIIEEIDLKNTKYISSAIARAKFLLSNSNNMEGKLKQILANIADEFNRDDTVNLNDQSDDILLNIFDIFPQNFIDGDSLYVIPIMRKLELPNVLEEPFGLREEERQLRKLAMKERNKQRFSKNNISEFVITALKENTTMLASTLPLDTRRDLIRMIFISMYGRHEESKYMVEPIDGMISIKGFRFTDFRIVRR